MTVLLDVPTVLLSHSWYKETSTVILPVYTRLSPPGVLLSYPSSTIPSFPTFPRLSFISLFVLVYSSLRLSILEDSVVVFGIFFVFL